MTQKEVERMFGKYQVIQLSNRCINHTDSTGKELIHSKYSNKVKV